MKAGNRFITFHAYWLYGFMTATQSFITYEEMRIIHGIEGQGNEEDIKKINRI